MLNGSGRSPKSLTPSLDALKHLIGTTDKRTNAQSKRTNPIPKRGPLSVLTAPGGPAGLCSLYVQYGGALPWSALVVPARQLALNGFTLSQRTLEAWRQGVREVLRDAHLGGEAREDFERRFGLDADAGDGFVNSELAALLDGLGAGGCQWFYGPGGPLESAFKYASRHGAPIELASDATLLLDQDDYQPSWDFNPPHQRIRVQRDGGQSAGATTDEFRLYAPGGNTQAQAAGEILEEIAKLDLDPKKDMEEYVREHVRVKREVFARRARGRARKNGKTEGGASGGGGGGSEQGSEVERGEHGGDTEGLTVADGSGMVVALTQSLGGMFGSGLCDPTWGLCLQGRGYGFALEADAHDHPNLYRPGKRPAHTLSPYLLHKSPTPDTNGWVLGIAAKGGDRVPYALTQALWPLLKNSTSQHGTGALSNLAQHLARPRFRDVAAGSPSPWAPVGSEAARTGGKEKLELEGDPTHAAWEDVREVPGFELVPPQSVEFEDSGFGVLHAVGVERVRGFQSDGSAYTYFAATDELRKPGRAAVLSREEEREGMQSADESMVVQVLQSLTDTAIDMQDDHHIFASAMRKIIITAGHQGCKKLDYNKNDWPVKCVNATSGGLKSHELPRAILLGMGDEHRTLAVELSFPVGSVPQMSCSAFQASIIEDKGAWIEWLNALGLGEFLPTTVNSDQFHQVLAQVADGALDRDRFTPEHMVETLAAIKMKFPLVLKLPATSRGRGVQIITNSSTLSWRVAEMLPALGSPFVLQEALAGNVEMTVNVVAYHGKILYADTQMFQYDDVLFVKSANRDSTEDWAKRTGGGMRTGKEEVRFEEQPEVAQRLVKEIVSKARLNGIVCVQYKTFAKPGGELQAKLIEVNAQPCMSLIRNGDKFPGVVAQWLQYDDFVKAQSSLQRWQVARFKGVRKKQREGQRQRDRAPSHADATHTDLKTSFADWKARDGMDTQASEHHRGSDRRHRSRGHEGRVGSHRNEEEEEGRRERRRRQKDDDGEVSRGRRGGSWTSATVTEDPDKSPWSSRGESKKKREPTDGKRQGRRWKDSETRSWRKSWKKDRHKASWNKQASWHAQD